MTTAPDPMTVTVGRESTRCAVVPEDLRLNCRERWRAANVLARRQGTPLARKLPPWRWISASIGFLGLTIERANTAGIGRSCVTTRIITKQHQLWFRVALRVSSATIVLALAALLVRPAEALRYVGPLGTSAFVLLVIVAAVENARYMPSLWQRRHDNDRAAAALRSAGHTGPISFVGGLVSENSSDVIELGRRWLRHVDQHGIALVTVARTERLARAYAVQGFQQVAEHDPLLLMRLPRDR
jgi:hypothetical protein